MAALGLGGYGSDDEEELENAPSGQQQEHEGLLGITLGVQSVQEQEALEPASGSGDAQRGSSEEPEERVEAAASGQGQGEATVGPGSTDEELLASLPPDIRVAPPGKPSAELEARLVSTAQTVKRLGISFIEQLQKRRDYSNPDFLQYLVNLYNLAESGTGFDPEVFDPNSLPADDYAEQLSKQLEQLQEKRKQARAEAAPGQASIAFERGAGAAGVLPASHSQSDLRGMNQTVPATAGPGAQALLQMQQLREQVAKNAAALVASGPAKRSKWDSVK